MAGKGQLGGHTGTRRVVDKRTPESAQVVAERAAAEADGGDQQDDQEQLPVQAITSDWDTISGRPTSVTVSAGIAGVNHSAM